MVANWLFIAIEADLDVRDGARDGAACAEFSWEGFDDGSLASGRAGPHWALPAASSATSSSTKATIQASSPNATDFFNGLLVSAGNPFAIGDFPKDTTRGAFRCAIIAPGPGKGEAVLPHLLLRREPLRSHPLQVPFQRRRAAGNPLRAVRRRFDRIRSIEFADKPGVPTPLRLLYASLARVPAPRPIGAEADKC
jgi:hypothetical protein